MALEPPDYHLQTHPTVPGQPGGGHDHAAAPAFAAGSAPLPPPGDPWQHTGHPAPAPARSGGGRGATIGLVIVSILAVVLLGVGGVMGYLWWDTSTELDDTRAELSAEIEELNSTVDARDDEIARLGDELQETRDSLSDAETQLEGTENMVELLEEQQDIVRDCILLSAEINIIIEDGDTPPSSLLDAHEEVCGEALDILGL
jgi:flagellar basal body-associated protein FliL